MRIRNVNRLLEHIFWWSLLLVPVIIWVLAYAGNSHWLNVYTPQALCDSLIGKQVLAVVQKLYQTSNTQIQQIFSGIITHFLIIEFVRVFIDVILYLPRLVRNFFESDNLLNNRNWR